MYYRLIFLRIFQKKYFGPAIHAIIFLSLFFLFTTGCSDSNSLTSPANGDTTNGDTDNGDTSEVEPLTDAVEIFFQDGDGEWTLLDNTEFMATGIFIPTVTDSDGRYGVAMIRVYAEDQEVYLYTLETTTAEIPQIDFSDTLALDDGTASLTVNVGEPDIAGSDIGIHLRDESDWNFNGISITYPNLESGNYDLILTQTEEDNDILNNYPSTLLARPDLAIDDGDSLVQDITTSDLAGSTVLAGPYTVTVRDHESGAPLDSTLYEGNVDLLTSNSTFVELGDKDDNDTNFEYTALGTLLADNNTYMLNIDFEPDEYRELTYLETFLNEGDKDISLPVDDFDLTFTDDISNGNLLPGMDIPEFEDVTSIGYSVYFDGSIAGIQYRAQSFITASRQTGTSFFLPDISSAEGWQSNWSIPADIETDRSFISVYLGSMDITDEALLAISGFSEGYEVLQQMEDGEWIITLRESIYSGGAL